MVRIVAKSSNLKGNDSLLKKKKQQIWRDSWTDKTMQKQPKNTKVKCRTYLKLLYSFKTILFSQHKLVDILTRRFQLLWEKWLKGQICLNWNTKILKKCDLWLAMS